MILDTLGQIQVPQLEVWPRYKDEVLLMLIHKFTSCYFFNINVSSFQGVEIS